MESALKSLEAFFFDIIGSVLPGLLLLAGLGLAIDPASLQSLLDSPTLHRVGGVWVLAAAGFIAGQAVTVLGRLVVWPVMCFLFGCDSSSQKNTDSLNLSPCPVDKPPKWRLVGEKGILAKVGRSPAFTAFVQSHAEYAKIPLDDIRTWRSLALGMLDNRTLLIERFMFIHLLNLGVATAILVPAVVAVVLILARGGLALIHGGPLVDLAHSACPVFCVFLLSLISAYIFVHRAEEFFNRTQITPFTMAVGKRLAEERAREH